MEADLARWSPCTGQIPGREVAGKDEAGEGEGEEGEEGEGRTRRLPSTEPTIIAFPHTAKIATPPPPPCRPSLPGDPGS